MSRPPESTTARNQPDGPTGYDQRAQRAADRIGEALRLPFAVARRVLPDRELPMYLGMGALAAAGVVDWPVAAAAGLGYAALRRWGRREPAGRAAAPPRSALRARSNGEATGPAPRR